MNTKVSFHQIAQNVAARADVSPEVAERFIKTLFEAASYALENAESVTIPGLGTFRRSEDAANPVAFVADGPLAKAVNAPFEMFEPQVLAAPESELQDIDSDTDRTYESVSEHNLDTEVESDLSLSNDDPPPPAPPTGALQEEIVEDITPAAGAEETAEPVPPTFTASAKPVEVPPVTLPPFPEEEEESHDYTPASVEAVPPVIPADYPSEQTNSRFGLGFIIGLLCGIAVGALAMFVLFTITTKDFSSEVMNESQMELESTQEALMNIGSGSE